MAKNKDLEIQKSESNIAVHQSAVPAAPKASVNMQEMGLDASDIAIPKMLLMQGLSQLVVDGTFQMGDLINSVTEEKLGDKNSPLEFIPMRAFKTWQVSLKITEPNGKVKYKFERNIPFTPENANLPYEGLDAEGREVKNVLTLNFYVLLASDIPGGEAFPYVVSFRSTSKGAGKNLATHFVKQALLRKQPWSKAMLLGCYLDKNDQGPYYVLEVKPSRPTTAAEVEAVETWLPIIDSGKTKVDDSDVDAVASPSADASSNNSKDF